MPACQQMPNIHKNFKFKKILKIKLKKSNSGRIIRPVIRAGFLKRLPDYPVRPDLKILYPVHPYKSRFWKLKSYIVCVDIGEMIDLSTLVNI